MDLFQNLIFGFGVALSWQNLLYCMIGVSVGTLIGVLPGIGPLATIAMLLPITFNVAPVARLIRAATEPVAGSGPSALGPVASGLVAMKREPVAIRRIALVMLSKL